MADRYKDVARMHPREFWSVYLLSAANMIDALCDQSERRFLEGSHALVVCDGEGDCQTELDRLAAKSSKPFIEDEIVDPPTRSKKPVFIFPD